MIHSTESGANSAESVARYFASSRATGSAHLVIDNTRCFRCLPNSHVPWAAPGANVTGFHIEVCGYAHWDHDTWWHEASEAWKQAAFKAALHCHVFRIPPVLILNPAELRKPETRGITTHATVSKAWGRSDHWDPGPNWPRGEFMNLVRNHYQRIRR